MDKFSIVSYIDADKLSLNEKAKKLYSQELSKKIENTVSHINKLKQIPEQHKNTLISGILKLQNEIVYLVGNFAHYKDDHVKDLLNQCGENIRDCKPVIIKLKINIQIITELEEELKTIENGTNLDISAKNCGKLREFHKFINDTYRSLENKSSPFIYSLTSCGDDFAECQEEITKTQNQNIAKILVILKNCSYITRLVKTIYGVDIYCGPNKFYYVSSDTTIENPFYYNSNTLFCNDTTHENKEIIQPINSALRFDYNSLQQIITIFEERSYKNLTIIVILKKSEFITDENYEYLYKHKHCQSIYESITCQLNRYQEAQKINQKHQFEVDKNIIKNIENNSHILNTSNSELFNKEVNKIKEYAKQNIPLPEYTAPAQVTDKIVETGKQQVVFGDMVPVNKDDSESTNQNVELAKTAIPEPNIVDDDNKNQISKEQALRDKIDKLQSEQQKFKDSQLKFQQPITTQAVENKPNPPRLIDLASKLNEEIKKAKTKVVDMVKVQDKFIETKKKKELHSYYEGAVQQQQQPVMVMEADITKNKLIFD